MSVQIREDPPNGNVWQVYGDLYIALNDDEVAVLAAMLQADVAWLQEQKKAGDANQCRPPKSLS